VRETVGLRPSSDARRRSALGARGARAGVGAEDEVGDVGGWAAPLGDGLGRRGRGQLRDGGGGDLHTGVQGRQRAVLEVRVRGEELLVQVDEALLDARLVTYPGELALEVGEVLAVCDAEVVVGVLVLGQARRRVRRADA